MKKLDNSANDKWDSRFLKLATFVAQWSKDPSTKVGAVLVRPNRTVAALGFNGFPRGVLDHAARYHHRPTKYEMVVHAETNALLSTRDNVEGYTLYVTPLPPCSQCAAELVQQGIGKIVISMPEKLPRKWAEKWEVSRTMFNEAGVSVCVIPQRKPKTSIKKTAKRSNDYITAGRIVRFKKAG
ncbi:MAG TPA: deaminase [Xanthobacteraceae bacterium]|jgi:dCMP deaminase|nr:deaminase [Xanthobacteraceae bacterium]